MLIFFDESFRRSLKFPNITLGVLCGVAIPEQDFHKVSFDLHQIKLKHLGRAFADDGEIKGKQIFSNWMLRLQQSTGKCNNLAFAWELLDYIRHHSLFVFGCVCFERDEQAFKCEDVRALDVTFKYIFERIDMFMKIKHPNKKAKLIFDDRDYGINKQNATAITNFFQRSAAGGSLDSILQTPFFAISQAQNPGLQLADFITTIVGLRFSSHPQINPYFSKLNRCFFKYYHADGYEVSSLKVMKFYVEKKKALDGP